MHRTTSWPPNCWNAQSIFMGCLLGTDAREQRALYCCDLEASIRGGRDIWYLGKRQQGTETRRKQLVSGHYAQPQWQGLPLAAGHPCTGCRSGLYPVEMGPTHNPIRT